jgi:hypothetical protein
MAFFSEVYNLAGIDVKAKPNLPILTLVFNNNQKIAAN